MKTERLYGDRKIVLEKFDNDDYRVTFFNDDNHWGGDIIFNEKDGVIHDDVKEEIEIEEINNFDYQKQWDEHDYDAVEKSMSPKSAYQFGCDDMKQKALDAFCNCICAGKRDIELYHECKTCKLYYEFEKLLNL